MKGIVPVPIIPFYGCLKELIESDNISLDFLGQHSIHYEKEETFRLYRLLFKGFGIVDTPIYLVENPTFFEKNNGKDYSTPYFSSPDYAYRDDFRRFGFFSLAVYSLLKEFNPSVVHIRNWGLAPLFAKMELEGLPIQRVFNLGNPYHQGNQHPSLISECLKEILTAPAFEQLLHGPPNDDVNLLKFALGLAHKVVASPEMAGWSAQPPDPKIGFTGGCGLEKVVQQLIADGKLVTIPQPISYEIEPSPAGFEKLLKEKRDARENLFTSPHHINPIIGIVGLAQPELELLLKEYKEYNGKNVLEQLLCTRLVNLAIHYSGQYSGQPQLRSLAEKYKPRVRLVEEKDLIAAEEIITLGSDSVLIPRLTDPQELLQLISMKNGVIPIMRKISNISMPNISTPYSENMQTTIPFEGNTQKALQEIITWVVQQWCDYHTYNGPFLKYMQEIGFMYRPIIDVAKLIEEAYTPHSLPIDQNSLSMDQASLSQEPSLVL